MIGRRAGLPVIALAAVCLPRAALAQVPSAAELAKFSPDTQAAVALMRPPVAPTQAVRRASEALASRVAEAELGGICSHVEISWEGQIRAGCGPETEIWSTIEVDPLLIEAFLPEPGRVPSFSSGAESLYRTTTSRRDLVKLTMAPRAKNPGPNESPYPVMAAHMEAGVVLFALNPHTQPRGIVTLCVGKQECTPGTWQLARAGVHWNGKTYDIHPMEKGDALTVLRTWSRPDRVYLKYTAPRGVSAPLIQNAFPHFEPAAPRRAQSPKRKTAKPPDRRSKAAKARNRRVLKKIQALRKKRRTRSPK